MIFYIVILLRLCIFGPKGAIQIRYYYYYYYYDIVIIVLLKYFIVSKYSSR